MNYEIYYPLEGKIDNVHQLNRMYVLRTTKSITFQLKNWELVGTEIAPYEIDTDNLGHLFFKCQNRMNFWNITNPCRSLSVGDIIRSVETDTYYICSSRDWKVIKMIENTPSGACAVSDNNIGPR
jgi:hypothetical protein